MKTSTESSPSLYACWNELLNRHSGNGYGRPTRSYAIWNLKVDLYNASDQAGGASGIGDQRIFSSHTHMDRQCKTSQRGASQQPIHAYRLGPPEAWAKDSHDSTTASWQGRPPTTGPIS
jgi:hypothetical protein